MINTTLCPLLHILLDVMAENDNAPIKRDFDLTQWIRGIR